jgi:hypothetical protein
MIDHDRRLRGQRLYHLSRNERLRRRALIDVVLPHVQLAQQLDKLIPANPCEPTFNPNVLDQHTEVVEYMTDELNKSIKAITGIDMLAIMTGEEMISKKAFDNQEIGG